MRGHVGLWWADGCPHTGDKPVGGSGAQGTVGPSSTPQRQWSLPTAQVGKLRHGDPARACCQPTGGLWGAGVTRGAHRQRGGAVWGSWGGWQCSSCPWRERWREGKRRGGGGTTTPGGDLAVCPESLARRGERWGVPEGGDTAPAAGWHRALRCGVHVGESPSSGGCGWGLRARGSPVVGLAGAGGGPLGRLCHGVTGPSAG